MGAVGVGERVWGCRRGGDLVQWSSCVPELLTCNIQVANTCEIFTNDLLTYLFTRIEKMNGHEMGWGYDGHIN